MKENHIQNKFMPDIESVYLTFTDEEKKALIAELPESQPEAKELFLPKAELACNWILWMDSAPQRTDMREQQADMLKNFKKSCKYLNKISQNKIYLTVPSLRDISGNDMAIVAANVAIQQAKQAEPQLQKIIKIIEDNLEPKNRSGSPGSYAIDFAKSIAHYYRLYFDIMPTTYDEGSFFKIIEQLFNILELDYKDPTRAVRAAVEFIKTSK